MKERERLKLGIDFIPLGDSIKVSKSPPTQEEISEETEIRLLRRKEKAYLEFNEEYNKVKTRLGDVHEYYLGGIYKSFGFSVAKLVRSRPVNGGKGHNHEIQEEDIESVLEKHGWNRGKKKLMKDVLMLEILKEAKGLPDFLMVNDKEFFFVEAKGRDGILTPSQKKRFPELRKLGYVIFVHRSWRHKNEATFIPAKREEGDDKVDGIPRKRFPFKLEIDYQNELHKFRKPWKKMGMPKSEWGSAYNTWIKGQGKLLKEHDYFNKAIKLAKFRLNKFINNWTLSIEDGDNKYDKSFMMDEEGKLEILKKKGKPVPKGCLLYYLSMHPKVFDMAIDHVDGLMRIEKDGKRVWIIENLTSDNKLSSYMDGIL